MVLDETLWGDSVLSGLKKDTVIVVNTDRPEKYTGIVENKIVTIDATKLALEILGRPITNTAMMGALVAVGGFVSLDDCKKAIENGMHSKIASKNINLIDKAYNMVKGA